MTFAKVFAAKLVEDVVNSFIFRYVIKVRSLCRQFRTEVILVNFVLRVAETPLAGTGTDNVDKLACSMPLQIYTILLSFYSSLGCGKVKLGELKDIERTGAAGIGLADGTVIVCTIRTELPQYRILTAADSRRAHHIVRTVGQPTSANHI